ncbi:F0F1 ATP synthase subunit A [Patescibacteria group bacterium]|nr:F0F1 ATP synthase subunit A [Patescibacteria group bacterium]MBU1612954.1 F0F1 ATP synthase subunit A [Patescibacteria group bacterium]
MHIPTLAPEVIFHIGGLSITNTIINTWIAIIIFLIVGIIISKNAALRPTKLQNFLEWTLESLFAYFDQVTGDRKKTIAFLPLVGSVFFFILLSNYLGLIPGTGSITWNNIMLFRPANTDLNLTVAMALTSVIVSHLVGLFSIGVLAHLNKFIQIGTLIRSLKNGPIAIFTACVEVVVGIIEIISEIAKVLSLSFRLFGNIFAGEVLMTVMSSLVALMVPTPFMLLELFVGLIQAGVFAMLTLVYLTVMSMKPHGEEAH